MKKAKIVFMGTPLVACPSLEAIIKEHEVPLVITQPDKPKGRGMEMAFPPVKELALKHNIEVLQPTRIKDNSELIDRLKAIAPDFLAVVAYGKLLPKHVLDLPKYAPINLHFSLLPKYRGSAPLNYAILNGDEETGVSTMKMDIGMDTGDILLMKPLPIEGRDAIELAKELSESGADLLLETINRYDSITAIKQDDTLATYAPMLSKDMGLIDWGKSAFEIERQVRGLLPWPSAYSRLSGKLIKIFKAIPSHLEESVEMPNGSIIAIKKDSFKVLANSSILEVFDLQLEGKKRMTVAQFLQGYKLNIGDILG